MASTPSPRPDTTSAWPDRPQLCREGLRLRSALVPLHAGAMHYWHLDRAVWDTCLGSMRALGLRAVDTYVPWDVHEIGKREYDFGSHDPRKDVVAFLRLAHQHGLVAIVRPGPHINAELTRFGLPERVVWRRACQARSPSGNAVFLPIPPLGFPVPSYGSETFFRQATQYLREVALQLSALQYPVGPVVLQQVDNEAALYFRDSAYDQDYHPDAVSLYRRFLARRYGPDARASDVYGCPGPRMAELAPPVRFDPTSLEQLAWHLDWAAFQEHLITRFLRRTSKRLRKAGLRALPTMHNLPVAEHASPLSIGSAARQIDLVGLDYYYTAGPRARRAIARRTTALAAYADAHDKPAFACELSAGCPPFLPPMSVDDNLFVALTALAYGLRGLSLYMAVERDRWIGAPIDTRGRLRPSAQKWAELLAMLDRVEFSSLHRRTPVRVVRPRVLGRLERVTHAFGPLSAAAFSVLGAEAPARCFEDDFGLEASPVLHTEAFLDLVERELEDLRIPFAFVDDDDPDACVHEARWILVATPGGALDPSLLEHLRAFVRSGGCVSFGPWAPERDSCLRPLRPGAVSELACESLPLVLPGEPASLRMAMGRAARDLALPSLRCEPSSVYATLHETREAKPRLVFLVNPGREVLPAQVWLSGLRQARDALDGSECRVTDGGLRVRVPGPGVRVIQVDVD